MKLSLCSSSHYRHILPGLLDRTWETATVSNEFSCQRLLFTESESIEGDSIAHGNDVVLDGPASDFSPSGGQSVEVLVWCQPVVSNGSMYFADTSGKVYSVKTADGSIQWTQSIGGEAGTAALGVPAVLDDALIYGLENGELVAISYSGDRLWTRSVNGTLYSGPVLAGDRLLVGVTQGDRLVVSFDLNGNESWSFTPAK